MNSPLINDYQNLFRSRELSRAQTSAQALTSPLASTTNSTKTPSTQSQDYADKVSLSVRAAKLQKISAEFFAGTIQSSQIPALTQRLYEEGFLNAEDYQSLGGQTQKVSNISEAQSFANRSLMTAIDEGDKDSAKGLLQVLDVLANMDLKSTPELRQAETQAYDFVAAKVEALKEKNAPANVLKGYQNLEQVLSALDKVRKQEPSTGVRSSYAQVQDAYHEMYNKK